MTNQSLLEKVKSAVGNGAHIIEALRQSLGYKVEELAVSCGFTADEISILEKSDKVESGKLERITSAVGVSPKEISALLQ